MKNGLLITIGVAVWAAIKGAAKLLKIIITLLTEIVIFFGLYIPLFYLLFGVVMLVATDFTLGGMGTDQIIYYVGLGLCCVASVIISIRNLVVRPLSTIFAPLIAFFRGLRRSQEDRAADREDAYRDAEGRYPEDRYEYGRDGYGYDRYEPAYRADGALRDGYGDPYDGRRGGYDDPYDEPARAYPPSSHGREQYARAYPREPYYYERRPDDRAPAEEYPYANAGYAAPAAMPSEGYGSLPEYRTESRYDDPQRYAPSLPYGESRDPRPVPSAARAREAERPLIYYSQRRPGILVMEYSDRFELYREEETGRVYVGTEYKDE